MSAAKKSAPTSAAAATGAKAKVADKKKTDAKAGASAKDKRPKGLPVLKVSVPLAAEARQARRRLSLATGNPADKEKNVTALDGAAPPDSEHKKETEKARSGKKKKGRQFGQFASLSHVGFVPFNPHKINQDRALEAVKFGGNEHRALFGVFDGHGLLGHEVSQFVSTELPNILAKQPTLEKKPKASLVKAFLDTNAALLKTKIDCTYSGTTGVVVYFNGGKMHCANAGDSRAVLATTNAALKAPEPAKPSAAATAADGKSAAAAAPKEAAAKADAAGADAKPAAAAATAAVAGKLRAVPLSFDHKPDVAEEKKRILDAKGRVHPCKTADGQDIGPCRVWIAHEDVPGLAMTRSFGDNVAASVGVCPNPQIVTHEVDPLDAFVIIASDGVWEFISNAEAVEIAAQADTPEAACRMLLNEATNRWQKEEEVIDDITVVVIFMSSYVPPPPPDPLAPDSIASSLRFAGADGAQALAAADTATTPTAAATAAAAAAAAANTAAPAAVSAPAAAKK